MSPLPNETLAYALLNQHVSWMSQSHGEPQYRAYGFFPDKTLSQFARNKAVEQAYLTFVHFDPRKREKSRDPMGAGDYPNALRLCHQHELSYINATPEFVREVLVRYFTATLPNRGFPVTMVDNEETGFECQIDEVALAAFAAECADHFMAHAITVRCFLAEPDSYALTEHGAWVSGGEQSSHVEDLATATT